MCEFQGGIHNSNVFASFAIYAFSQKKKRPQSVSGPRSLIEYGSNAKAEFSKEMDVCASQRTHPKPKQLRKTLFSKKEFNLPKKKEFVKNLYIRYEVLTNIM